MQFATPRSDHTQVKIRVFADLRFTTSETPTGVGKHIYQMARGLTDTPGNEVSLLAASDQAGNPGVLDFLPVTRMPLHWKAASALWAVGSRPYADRWCGDADWVYCPKNDWLPLRTKRLAVTIHGAHELDPDVQRPAHPLLWAYRLRSRVQYRKICRRADVVFTVSEFLRQQVIDWFHASPEKVVVVGNGVEQVYFDAGEDRKACSSGFSSDVSQRGTSYLQTVARPYLLTLGGLNHLDGGDRILAVADELARSKSSIRILVAGNQHDSALRMAIRDHTNVELLGYLPAARLAPLLSNALALFHPTRYETFGMGAVEAMASGTVVITCRNTAVPEIVGAAGIYVDPEDPGEVASALQSLLGDPELRKTHLVRGRERAANYTWKACVTRLQRELEKRT